MALSPKDSPIAKCVAQAGDPIAGLLLYRIHYHWGLKGGVHRDGERWIANDYAYWGADCGLTPKQLRRALGILRRNGSIVTRVYQFRRLTTLHVRLPIREGENSRVASQNGPARSCGYGPSEQVAHVPGEQVPSYAGGLSGDHTGSFLNSDPSDGIEKKPLRFRQNQEEEPGKPLPELKEKNLREEIIIVDNDIETGRRGLYPLWLASLRNIYPDQIFPNTSKQRGQMLHFSNALGEATPTICDDLSNNWPSFIEFIYHSRRVRSFPDRPDIGFALAWVEVVAEWHSRFTKQREADAVEALERAGREAASRALEEAAQKQRNEKTEERARNPLKPEVYDPPVTLKEFLEIVGDLDV